MDYKKSLFSYLSKEIPHIFLIIRLYLLAILTFSLFRLLLFFTQYHRVIHSVTLGDTLHAFIIGIRFDIVISGYILILPYLVFTLLNIVNTRSRIVSQLVFSYTFVLLSLAFSVNAADIPYFNQFYSRFSVTAFEWMNSPSFVFKMIVEEPRYWLMILPLIGILFITYRLLRYFWKLHQTEIRKGNLIFKACISLIFLGLIFLGIRGRIEKKSPIRIGTAYFSNNAFLNQLGLNPNFTLIRSYLDSRKEQNRPIQLMNNELAIQNVRKYLNISPLDPSYPLARSITFGNEKPLSYNVVLVIMESMSANKMTRHGNTRNLTPFLDSISQEGLYFDQIYTAGIHTFNGIFSTLFSYPAIFRQHPMKESSMLKYNGLPNSLKKAGYSTIYFTTHDGQFDNVEGFLLNNDVEKVISKPCYPIEEVKTTLGVPDDIMFEYSIPVLNALAAKDKPFLAAFMTASDHGPFYIPGYFKPRSSSITDQIVEYADWSLRKLVNLSSQQKWFSNTIFVFVADHGAPVDGTYEMPVSYYHTPLLFYCPALLNEKHTQSNIGGQIDIFPTIMGLLHQPYTNNSPGIDLNHETRPFIFVNGDDKYGVFSSEWLLIVKNDGTIGLFRYSKYDTNNYAAAFPDVVEQMKRYAESNLQVTQFNITHGKQYFSR